MQLSLLILLCFKKPAGLLYSAKLIKRSLLTIVVLNIGSTMSIKLYFNSEDASQIAIGAFAMAMPIAFTQEAWQMAETLPLINLVLLALLSLFFLTHYTYFSLFQSDIKYRVFSYVVRIFLAYFITLIVVGLILLALNKFPIQSEPWLALKRLVIIAMPASLGAIIVDSFDKE